MNPVVRLRMALAVGGRPNCALPNVVFQLGKVTWLSGLVESIRRSPLNRSVNRKVRPSEAFKVNCDGTGNGIASRIAPLARKRRGVSRWIQRQARRRGVHGRARVIRPQSAGDAGALYRRQITGVSGRPVPADDGRT